MIGSRTFPSGSTVRLLRHADEDSRLAKAILLSANGWQLHMLQLSFSLGSADPTSMNNLGP